ncbi:MAG: S41 family peptidase [Verrucomicrobiales bacterium]|nr:S41 family peptidase [Verrucomicrobiales bacterium]
MTRSHTPLLFILAALAPLQLSAQEESAEPPSDPIDSIGMAGLQEAFRILRSKYIHNQQLTPLEINRAALQGVVDRLEFGAELVTGPPPPPPYTTTFRKETLPGSIGYLRPATFHADEITAIDDALGSYADDIETLILDLRAPAPHGDFAVAAEIADRFVAEGKTLIRIVKSDDKRPRVFTSKRQPAWEKNLILLFDEQSNNVAEAAAAAIAINRPTFSIGLPTPGRTVEYQNISISADLTLRLAVAEALIGDDTSLFKVGTSPDLISTTDHEAKKAAFTAPKERPLPTFIFEAQRPRLNEAALVQKTNPELPYLISRTKKEKSPFDTSPVIDRVLQNAIDMVNTDSFLEIPKPPQPEDGTPPTPEEQ